MGRYKVKFLIEGSDERAYTYTVDLSGYDAMTAIKDFCKKQEKQGCNVMDIIELEKEEKRRF